VREGSVLSIRVGRRDGRREGGKERGRKGREREGRKEKEGWEEDLRQVVVVKRWTKEGLREGGLESGHRSVFSRKKKSNKN
jgi:hypothetical protein